VAEPPGLRRKVQAPGVGGVKARITIAAGLVVSAALVIGAIAMVVAIRSILTRDVRNATRLRADGVASALASGAGFETLVVAENDEQLVQILDAKGSVIASSPNVAGDKAVAQLRPGTSATIRTPINDHDDFMAVAFPAHVKGAAYTVIVAQALAHVGEVTGRVSQLLLLGLPLLLALLFFTIWKVVGRALAPVEAIRREVEAISSTELHRRVPEAGGDDEIARLALTMNRMLGRLDAAHARQRSFVSDASHELRSPVASIRQHAEVALAHPETTTTTDLAETVLAENLRLQRLVDDLLLLARVDEHTLQINRRQLDLDDLVFDEAARLRETTAFKVDTKAVSAARVEADAMGIGRLLRNLVDNATHHANHCISFTLVKHNGSVVLTIDDDGPGIPVEDRGRVWERFVRLDTARARDEGGSGLGLAIVAELVAAHDGSVALGDSDLGGTRVAVTLPALR